MSMTTETSGRYFSWVVVGVVLFIVAASGGWGSPVPPPEAVPAVLLSAPVNATWAAANSGLWREKGIQGFLLSGIADGFESHDAARHALLTDKASALVEEIRLANERLRGAGVSHNFCLVPMTPGLPFFVEPATATAAASAVEDAAVFCGLAGLAGIAIDSRSSGLFYDFRWDGYSYKNYTADDLSRDARDFGKRLGRVILKSFPTGKIVLITDSCETWSPLYISFLTGLFEGISASGGAPVHLLTRESNFETDPARLAQIAECTRRVLHEQLKGRSRTFWDKHGSIGLGMSPLAYKETDGARTPAANYSAEAFRVQAASAKINSDSYAWIDSNGALWWQVPESDIPIYSASPQNGARLREQTRPLPPEFAGYSARTPFDGFRRVGPLAADRKSGHGSFCYVFDSEEGGAAAAFLFGLAESVSLDVETPRIPVIDLKSGQKRTLEANGKKVALEADPSPVLIENLPVRTWVLPAGLWMAASEMPTPSLRTVSVEFGFANRTYFTLSGSLAAVVSTGYSMRPSQTEPTDLPPLADLTLDGILRGNFVPGARIVPILSIVSPGTAPETRTFSLEVIPDQAWSVELDGIAPRGVTAVDIHKNGVYSILASSEAGDVTVINGEGAVQWKRRFPSRFDLPPTAGLTAAGSAMIAVVDASGVLWVLDEGGNLTWEKALNSSAGVPGACFAHLTDSPGDEIVVALADGQVNAYHENGKVLWAKAMEAGTPFVCVGQAPGEKSKTVYVARGGVSSSLSALGRDGALRWSKPLESTPACEPIVADLEGDGTRELVTATVGGVIRVWRMISGEVIAEKILETKPVMGLTVGKLDKKGKPSILVSCAPSLVCLAHDLKPVWSKDIRPSGAATVVNEAGGAVILVPAHRQWAGNYSPPTTPTDSTRGATLLCLDRDGGVLWQDPRSPAALSGSPNVLVTPSGISCVYAARDRVVREISVKK